MHPLIDNLDSLKDTEIEHKISDLNKKYFMVRNQEVRKQILNLLETYRQILTDRRSKEYSKVVEHKDKNLDNLINIS